MEGCVGASKAISSTLPQPPPRALCNACIGRQAKERKDARKSLCFWQWERCFQTLTLRWATTFSCKRGGCEVQFPNLHLSRPFFAGFLCLKQIGELPLIILNLQPPLHGSLSLPCPLQRFADLFTALEHLRTMVPRHFLLMGFALVASIGKSSTKRLMYIH